MKELRERADKPALGAADPPLEMWEKILEHPLAIGLIGKVFGLDTNLLMQDGKIAGIPGDRNLDNIIEGLYSFDPDLDKHLYKLKTIAEKNPGNFKILIGMLEKM